MTIDVIFTPGHSPGHVTYSVRDEEAMFSGDVLFQGSVGRVDLPGGDGPTLLRSIRGLLDSHSPETGVYPGHMGVTTLGAERATQSVPRRAGALTPRAAQVRSRHDGEQVPGTARDLRRPARPPRAPGARIEAAASAIFARAGYEPIATPAFEDTELFERGVGRSTDIVRKEMFTFEDKGGRSITLRPGGHGADLPRLPRARHAQAGAAGEALLRRARSSATSAPRPAATASSTRSASRRSAPTRRSPTPRRSCCSPTCSPSSACRASSCGSAASARRTARSAYLEELKAHLRAHEGELSKDVRERIEINPLRAFDADDEGTRGGDGERADDRRAARRGGRRALRRGARAARGGRDRLRRSTRPWSAASTTTRGRSSPSSATGSAPSRRSAAAAATTG